MTEMDVELLRRLAHYAFLYVPGPKWDETEAAMRARQSHLDGVAAEELAEEVEAGFAWLVRAKVSDGDFGG